jgi:DNA-binding HxlR family transcriptional regulator
LSGTAESDGPSPRAPRAWTPLARALKATGDHWTLAIALALAPGKTRLTDLRDSLPGVSTGVLARGLQQMVALGLVRRTRFKEMPPRVELELTSAGRELVPIARELARWGMRHCWSQPQECELVDLEALLQMLPALLDPEAGLPDGSLDAWVTDGDVSIRCTYRVRAGRLQTDGGQGGAPQLTPSGSASAHTANSVDVASASVHGTRSAWIGALGPSRDRTALRINGDEEFACQVFDALPGSSTSVCHNGGGDRQRRDSQGA